MARTKATLQPIEQTRRKVVALGEPVQPPQGTARWEELQRMVKRVAPAGSVSPQPQSAPALINQRRHTPSGTQLVRDLARAEYHGVCCTSKATISRARTAREDLNSPLITFPATLSWLNRDVILAQPRRYLGSTATLSWLNRDVILAEHTP